MSRSLDPQHISEFTWYYEEARGLLVVHEARQKNGGAFIQTDQFTIPWTMIESSLKRRRAKAKPKRKRT